MPVAAFTLPSYAKINLHLRILGKRADGFHELCTVFQTVSLKDNLTFAPSEQINLTCSDEKIPLGEENLIVKAAQLLQEKFKIASGATIHLEKNIPSPGGLGGGSSNAAVALIGLTRLWKIKTDVAELETICNQLGSDVPFFLHGGTALGTGRGNIITEMDDFTAQILIVAPVIDVSTAAAFKEVNAPRLTNKSSKSILQICCSAVDSLDLSQAALVNDFEKPIFNIEPEIKSIKQKLLDFGAKQALLSGSGASIFGVFNTARDIENALENLKSEPDWKIFSTRTISRREYRSSLGINKVCIRHNSN